MFQFLEVGHDVNPQHAHITELLEIIKINILDNNVSESAGSQWKFATNNLLFQKLTKNF